MEKFNMPVKNPCGCYILLLAGAVVYVGSSRNVFSRIMQHSSEKSFDEVKIVWTTPANRRPTEALLIKELSPELNVHLMSLVAQDSLGKINWKWQTDAEIARQIGCSREYVRLMRIALQKPICDNKFRHSGFVAFRQKFMGRIALLKSEVEALPHCPSTLKIWCSEIGIAHPEKTNQHSLFPIKRTPWEDLDWDLPNWLISELTGVGETTVARERAKFGKRDPRFDGRKFTRAEILEQAKDPIEIEKQKIAAWRTPK